MKTLYDHLHRGGIFDYKKADEIASKVRDFAKNNYELEKDNLIAVYRFTNLTLSYLHYECNKEDFSWSSLFKLLKCQIKDVNFKTNGYTVYEFMMEEGGDKHDVLYVMYKYFINYANDMESDMFELFNESLKAVSHKFDIEYDSEAMEALWKNINEVKEEKGEAPKIQEDQDKLLLDFLKEFKLYRQTGEDKYYDNAREILEDYQCGYFYDEIGELLEEWMEEYEELIGFFKILKGKMNK